MSTLPRTQTTTAESSPRLQPVDAAAAAKSAEDSEAESGYGSAPSSSASSTAGLPRVTLTPAHLKHINRQLEHMQPMDILRFAKIMFPNLFQTTAFGLTGLVTLDMLSRLHEEEEEEAKESGQKPAPVEVIFLDTLYHFPETYELVERVRARYPHIKVHSFKPAGFETAAEFEATYGKLYELSEEMYDYVAKVEPQQRAYETLDVAAVLTGRRRSQGGQRDRLDIVELDAERGVFKVNPMANWSFARVRAYVRERDVPYNPLLDRGYKSVGDWHSTSPVAEGEDERAGRWKGRAKTECGIHNKKSRYAQFLEEASRREHEERVAAALREKQQQQQQQEEKPAEQATFERQSPAVELAPAA